MECNEDAQVVDAGSDPDFADCELALPASVPNIRTGCSGEFGADLQGRERHAAGVGNHRAYLIVAVCAYSHFRAVDVES